MSTCRPRTPSTSAGRSDFGRWHLRPLVLPSTPVCGSDPEAVKPFCIEFGPVANEYAGIAGQPPERPGTPNPSWGAEAFLDTMLVNGTVYPKLTVPAGAVRFRILNASHDRFLNLQLYRAVNKTGYTNPTVAPRFHRRGRADLTEVAMVPAGASTRHRVSRRWSGRRTAGKAACPIRPREGPPLSRSGPKAVSCRRRWCLPNQPVVWNIDPTLFNVGNVLQQNEGGGTLFLGPAERADVIVDFTDFAGHTLILYNDAPTAFPALVPQYDYYTGAPDRTDIGGYGAYTIPPGVGPNIRTVMQITVASREHPAGAATPDYYRIRQPDRAADCVATDATAPASSRPARTRSSWGRPPTELAAIPLTTLRSRHMAQLGYLEDLRRRHQLRKG